MEMNLDFNNSRDKKKTFFARLKQHIIECLKQPFWLGTYLLLLSIILTLLIYMLWPDTTVDKDGKIVYGDTWKFFGSVLQISNDARLILIVLLTGALGSFIHAATSFVTFMGNRALVPSWFWWYFMRPFIGGTLALIFYFVIRGGFLSTGADVTNISIFGIAGLSGLVGMFSKNAIDKLREVFETLFKSEAGKGDEARLDKGNEKVVVETVMIPLNKISTFQINSTQPIDQVPLVDLYTKFKDIVTRIPVVDEKNLLKYLIHQSILFKFIADKSVESASTASPYDINTQHLSDFVNDPAVNEFVEKSLVFVSKATTLGEAKQKMEATKNCQDVFVTETGLPTEPMLGWLTNVDIARNIAG